MSHFYPKLNKLSNNEYFTSNLDILGKKLKLLRELRNFSQEDIASELGISQNTYSRIENNQASLKANNIEKLAKFLNISITDLLSKSQPVISFSNNSFVNDDLHNRYEKHNETTKKLEVIRDFEIATLKEEVTYLRKQNEELLKIVGKGKN